MALKSNWQTGEAYTAADANLVADAVNHGPYDMTVICAGEKTKRAVGVLDLWSGVPMPRAVTLNAIRFMFFSADASGSTTVELRKNGTAIAGTSKTVAAADQTAAAGAAREITGLTVSLAKGDVLTVYVTSVGTTPGSGLAVSITAVTA